MSAQTNNSSGASALDIAYKQFDLAYEDYLAGRTDSETLIEYEQQLESISTK